MYKDERLQKKRMSKQSFFIGATKTNLLILNNNTPITIPYRISERKKTNHVKYLTR